MSLLDQIRFRIMELIIRDDLPRAEALKQAAKEFSKAELIKSKAKPKPAIATDDRSSAKEELFGRVMSIRERMFGAESKRVLTGESPSEAVGSPPASQEPSPLPTERTRLRAPESEG